MSGGVGPVYSDISLPDDRPPPRPLAGDTNLTKPGLFTLRQLNLLGVIGLLASSGLVSFYDIAFVAFSIVYILILNGFVFQPKNAANPKPSASVFSQNNFLAVYAVLCGGIIGMLLPAIYIGYGIIYGDREGAKSAAPHLFLLCCQVFLEGVALSMSFSRPVQALVSVMYNTKRLFTLFGWIDEVLGESIHGRELSSIRMVQIGRGLALANFVIWSFNLFCLLLPLYLPREIKTFYLGNQEDKRDD